MLLRVVSSLVPDGWLPSPLESTSHSPNPCLPPTAPVVFPVHQMVTGPECHQMGVISRRRDGHGASAADVGVAQLVGQLLELVGRQVVVVPEHVVVGGPGSAL
jgi:hypothetical protein